MALEKKRGGEWGKKKKRTNLLISLLLPFRNQIPIRIPILQQPLIQLLRNSLLLIIQVVDVAATLMRDLEDGPERLVPLFALVGGVFGVFHFVGEFEEGVF